MKNRYQTQPREEILERSLTRRHSGTTDLYIAQDKGFLLLEQPSYIGEKPFVCFPITSIEYSFISIRQI